MKFLSIKDAENKYNLSDKTIYQYIREKKYNSIEVDSKKLIIEDKDSPIIMSFINMKGGCSKTTSSVNIASYLSLCGLKVLVIDLDHQDQCKAFFQLSDSQYSTFDLFFSDVDIKQIIRKTDLPNLDLVTSNLKLSFNEKDLYVKENSEYILSDKLKTLKNSYDIIIIDNSPSFNIYNQNSILASTHVIIPVTPDNLGLMGIDELLEIIQSLIVNKNIKIAGIFFGIVDSRTNIAKGFMEAIKGNQVIKDYVFDTFIPEDVRLRELSLVHQNIFTYKNNSRGAQSYKKLTYEILTRL